MKYETELPELVLDNTRYESTSEFRPPKKGEVFVNVIGEAERTNHTFCDDKRIILRPVWTWPEWLSGWGIAADENGRMYWYAGKATRGVACWTGGGGYGLSHIQNVANNFTPPTITDWTKPILNTRWKGSADAH